MASLGYEKTEFDSRTFYVIQAELENDTTTRKFYTHIAKIGFLKTHKMLIEDLEKAYADTKRKLFEEQIKSPRDEGLLIRLKYLQIEQGNQIEELLLGNQTMAGIQAKMKKKLDSEIAK